MKRFLSLFLITMISGIFSMGFSQIKPEVSETQISYQGSKINGFISSIPYAKPDDVKKAWIKTIEKGTKSKVKENGSYDISIADAELDDITDSLLNVYSMIETKDTMIYLHAAFEIGYDEYISSSSYSSEAQLVRLFLFEFAKEQYVEVIEEEFKEEEKKLKGLEKELNQLVRDKVKLEKSIEDFNNDILVANDEIRGFEYDSQVKQNEINEQKVKVGSISPSNKEALKEAESFLKDLEKEKKRIFRSIEKNQKDIVGYNSKINQAKLDIQTNINEQSKKRNEIQKQISVVGEVEARLVRLISMDL
jgi:hypothetical protein